MSLYALQVANLIQRLVQLDVSFTDESIVDETQEPFLTYMEDRLWLSPRTSPFEWELDPVSRHHVLESLREEYPGLVWDETAMAWSLPVDL